MTRFLILFLWLGVSQVQKDGLVPFEQGELWGYKNAAGKIVIPPKYLSAGEFSASGIAAVADQRGWAMIDSSGAVLIRPYVFDNGPDYFSQGLARFVTAGRFGFFDERGKIVIPARFDFVEPFHDGMAAFCEGCVQARQGEHLTVKGGKWGYIDRKGKTVVRAIYDEARPFENGLGRVRLGGEWKNLDAAGRPVAPR
jgi:hypothetical protein